MARWAMQVLTGNFLNAEGVQALGREPDTGNYVAHYDLDFRGGKGAVEITDDPDLAMTWDSTFDVYAAWKQVSPSHPMRADGKINRPLTALTITAVDLDEPREEGEGNG